ncbi:MAG: WYL domain-containing protein, partial [Chloroflexota bacterium]
IEVHNILNCLYFYATPNEINVERQIMSAVASSAWQTITVNITYQSRNGDETERQFDPYGVVYYQQDWHTVGFCHLRKDIRIFRLDRISTVETTDQTFTPRPDFDVLDYVVDALSAPNGYQVEVIFETTLEKAQRSLPPRLGTFEVVEDGILFTCSALRLDWIAALMLSLDFPIRILQPQALRDELRTLAQKAL